MWWFWTVIGGEGEAQATAHEFANQLQSLISHYRCYPSFDLFAHIVYIIKRIYFKSILLIVQNQRAVAEYAGVIIYLTEDTQQ